MCYLFIIYYLNVLTIFNTAAFCVRGEAQVSLPHKHKVDSDRWILFMFKIRLDKIASDNPIIVSNAEYYLLNCELKFASKKGHENQLKTKFNLKSECVD